MSNTDQIDYWNGDGGGKWVKNAELLDAMMAPFADAILSAAKLQPGEHVLDVGCGGGALSLRAAEQVGGAQGVVGVDVSEALLGLARQRAAASGAAAKFKLADASTFRGDKPFDALISRFGVMFFDDPVAAFAALNSNMKRDGRLAFACWQSLAVNDWARAPSEVAMPFLTEPLPTPQPHAPGPFAFADKDRTKGLLEAAGWKNVSVAPWVGDLILPGDTPSDAANFMMRLGPVARLVEQQGADLAAVSDALEQRMQDLANDDGRVTMSSATWIVTANAA